MAKKKKGGKGKGKGKGEAGGEAAAADEAKEAEPEAKEAETEAQRQEKLRLERLQGNIRSSFRLFDKEGNGCVLQEDVGTLVRYLGQFPSEEDLAEHVLPMMQHDEPNAFVPLSKFEPRMLEMLVKNEYPPEDQQVLLSAFKALDEERKGYVEVDYLRELLTQMNTPFRSEELDSFLNVSRDVSSGRIYYEDYVNLYASQVDAIQKHWRDSRLAREALLQSTLSS